jgi:HEAT repeat protein
VTRTLFRPHPTNRPWANPRARRAFLVTLGTLGLVAACRKEDLYHDKPLAYWVAALRSPDPTLRAEAVEAIGEASPRTTETVNLLLNTLATESDSSLHPNFASALGRLGEAAAPAVPRLAELLRDDHEEVRVAAAAALGNIGAAASHAVWALAHALRDCCHDVRAGAAEALGRIGPGASEAVPALIDALGDPISWVRLQSATALVAIKPQSRDAAEGFTRALGDSREEVRAMAAIGLSQYGASAVGAAPVLRRLLADDPYPAVRIAAAKALGTMGPASRAALPELLSAQRDSDFAVRAAVREAIAKIGPGS